jgi:hypothetical protein
VADTEHGAVSIRSLGADDSVDRWRDYRSILPPQEYDESYLLDLVNDTFAAAPADGPLIWVPLHAWRALGQMGSRSVLEPVLRLAEGDDYPHAYDDFAQLSALIGEPAIDPLIAILRDRSRSELHRTLAAKGLGAIGRGSTGETRRAIVESLMNQMRNQPQDGWVNGAAAAALIAMDERSVGPEVLKMYKEGRIQGVVEEAEVTGHFGPLPE